MKAHLLATHDNPGTAELSYEFAEEGEHGHVLLSLGGFSKKTRKTPPDEIELAERRLRDWRDRGSTR